MQVVISWNMAVCWSNEDLPCDSPYRGLLTKFFTNKPSIGVCKFDWQSLLLAKFALLHGLLSWHICTLLSNVKLCYVRYKAHSTVTREHWNWNAHWGEMSYGMESETTTGCGIQEGYAGPSNNSSGLLIAWYPIVKRICFNVKNVFRFIQIAKKTDMKNVQPQPRSKAYRDVFFGLGVPLLTYLTFQKFWCLDFKSG